VEELGQVGAILVEHAQRAVARVGQFGRGLDDAAEHDGEAELDPDRDDGVEEVLQVLGIDRRLVHVPDSTGRRPSGGVSILVFVRGQTVAVPIKVFLLDDHEIVRRGLRELLESAGDMEVVAEAGTAEEALRRLPVANPDVAVLDVRLPDGNGVEVCREIRSRMPAVHCLMLTSYADDEALFDAIMAGASGYVLKQIRATELVDAVRKVAAGQSLLDPGVTARVLERLRSGTVTDEKLEGLTDQERRILDLLAEGLTNREIADRMYLAEKTVKNYVSNLLSKMGMQRRTEAAVYAARLSERQRRTSD
jgi:two-component system response regulator DevR